MRGQFVTMGSLSANAGLFHAYVQLLFLSHVAA